MAPLGQVQEALHTRPMLDNLTPVVTTVAAKEIPYDYVARFHLRGQRGNRIQDVINVSVEGAFVAVAIGYSFLPARRHESVQPSRLDLNTRKALFDSYRSATVNRYVGPLASQGLPGVLALLQHIVDPIDLLRCLQLQVCGIDFKYSVIDSGTGRELQNQPIHNVAGLGESGGNRPFRPFAKPALFLPRSTIRIEVEEISEGPLYGYDDENDQRVGAELFIVLHGYKILGYRAGPA